VGIFIEVEKLEQLGRCLHAGLHRITTVDEQGRPLRHDDGEAGGAVETRDPVQPLGIGGNVLPRCSSSWGTMKASSSSVASVALTWATRVSIISNGSCRYCQLVVM
jgi:hypothetical protein